MKDKLFIFSPDNIQNWEDDKKEHFVRKTMMKIAHDENLKPCFESNEGKLSLVDAVQKSCSTGLEIGGKHAYLIPQPRKTGMGKVKSFSENDDIERVSFWNYNC
mgnify:CR=1 FL=1